MPVILTSNPDKPVIPATRLKSQLWWDAYFKKNQFPGFDWKTATQADWMKFRGGHCDYCDGYLRAVDVENVEDGKYRSYYCVCSTLSFRDNFAAKTERLQSFCGPAKLSELQVYGDANQRTAMTTLKHAVVEWVKDPTFIDDTHKPWFYISGNTGTGKTHILKAIRAYFSSLALYVSVEDFQAQIHMCLEKNSQLNVQEYIQILSAAPILLFDDLGAEHEKSRFFISQLYAVINRRYNHGPKEWPLIVTSNNDIGSILTSPDRDLQRIASRMVDRQYVQVHKLLQADYRLSGGK